jgi:hypothetical protein
MTSMAQLSPLNLFAITQNAKPADMRSIPRNILRQFWMNNNHGELAMHENYMDIGEALEVV